MDVSNPVITGEKVKLGDFKNQNILLKRQDYKFLDDMVSQGKRRYPPRFDLPEYEVDEAKVKRMETSGVLVVDKGKLEVPLLSKRENVLVGKFHPKGICMKGAHVSVMRKFPQRKRIKPMLKALLKFNPYADEEIEKVTYTGGTKSGFIERLRKWGHRKPKNMKPILAEWGYDGIDILKETMPLSGPLKDWNADLKVLIDDITINRTSSAGPPFFTEKYRCMDEIFAAIKEIVEAISNDTIDEYWNNNPEMIMSECKNKMDRYDIDNVKNKTRPYWGFSAPISFLISVLCQDFCSNLHKFDIKGSNAYGFAWAHGGGKKLWDWMVSTKEGEIKYCIYGDDTRLVYRKEGILYCVDPDFEQMDGSVDKDSATIGIAYIHSEYEKQWGPNKFWKYICNLWLHLAVGSEFFVEGEKTYSNETGCLSGVVGITYHDCVKSQLAYKMFVVNKINPLNIEESTVFFQKMGLQVKAGTWQPMRIDEELEEGKLCVETKFLGSMLRCVMGSEELEPIPYIIEEDLLKLVGNLRQQVVVAGTTLERRLFDTARGYMITSAFHHPRIWNSLCQIIDDTRPEIIVQRVQACDGKGEQPELIKDIDEDFEWPSSDGYPSQKFCMNVYLQPNNIFEEEDLWIYAFPDLVAQAKAFRKQKKIVVEPFKPKENLDWNDDMAADDVHDALVDKMYPSCDVEGAVLTKAKFKAPKNFVRFRELKVQDVATKQNRLQTIIEPMEEVHHVALTLLLPYGGYWITQQMLKEGWFYTAHGFWTRDSMKQAKHVTSVWGYEERRALGENGLKSEPVSSVSLEPDIPAEGVVFDVKLLKVVQGSELPKEGMDDVSWISALFVNSGCKLREESKVLSQQPARVKVAMHIIGVEGELGSAVSISKKEAKRKLMNEMRKYVMKQQVLGFDEEEQTVELEDSEVEALFKEADAIKEELSNEEYEKLLEEFEVKAQVVKEFKDIHGLLDEELTVEKIEEVMKEVEEFMSLPGSSANSSEENLYTDFYEDAESIKVKTIDARMAMDEIEEKIKRLKEQAMQIAAKMTES